MVSPGLATLDKAAESGEGLAKAGGTSGDCLLARKGVCHWRTVG